MRILFLILVCCVITPTLSQKKVIIGDTTFWYDYNKNLYTELELEDMYTSKTPFKFRYSRFGRIIEISKDNSISGQVTYYVYHRKKQKSPRDTIFQTYKLSTEEVTNAYELIKSYGIQEIPSENDIYGWGEGFDGETFIFESSSTDTFSYKTYWCPYNFDTIPEARIVWNFITEFEDTLNLDGKRRNFYSKIPDGYYSSGGIVLAKQKSSRFRTGYIGSIQLPFGYSFMTGTYRLFKKRFISNININHLVDFRSNFDFNISFSKYDVFIKYTKDINDFLISEYRIRDNISTSISLSENYQLYYGLRKDNLHIGIGLDYNNLYNDLGYVFYFRKYFSDIGLNSVLKTSITKQNFDIRFEIDKNFDLFRKSYFNNSEFGTFYERFNSNNNFGVYIRTYW